ncbi:MAG TPA: DinB family protein [Anaerolineaceae bacterium]|nr:DinB family protein [Anaerolineaceae bacterium]
MDELIATVRNLIATTPGRWQALAGLAGELLRRPAAPGEWSALECLQHIIYIEHVYQFRLRAMLAGENFPSIEAGLQPGLPDDPAAQVAEFARLRAETLAALATLTPADLTRQVTHPELGPVTLAELLHTWAAHDLNHTVQAERALMQPFIAGCGPWQVYYRDQVLQQE